MNISIITFTENGTKLAEKIRQAFVGTKTEEAKKLGLSLSDWTRQQFAEKNAIVVIGACGIAVRMIAPFVSDKLSDSPVVVADEAGTFVIPLLSGHMGGANELAEQIAGQIGGIPVITTATDGRGVFAADSWAVQHGCAVKDIREIQYISGGLLRGEQVGLRSDFSIAGALPDGVQLDTSHDCGMLISVREPERLPV